MSRPSPFTAAAAQRHADAVNRGAFTIIEVRSRIRDRFDLVYGWPLTRAQAEEYEAFWRDVLSRIPGDAE